MNFKAYSKYYDLLYTGKDYSAEVAYIDTLIKCHAPAAKHIFEKTNPRRVQING